MAERAVVDYWFDPICPWAWMTSRWIKEVEKVRDIEVVWHPFSLTYLNRDNDLPESYRQSLATAWPPVRLVAEAKRTAGNDAIDRLYTSLGTLIHNRGEDRNVDSTLARAIADAGLPDEILGAAHSEARDDDIKASTDRALALVGDEVGVPVIRIEDVAFFGPVVSPAPRGEDAGRLWDGCRLVAGTDGFYELKRSRDRDPIFD